MRTRVVTLIVYNTPFGHDLSNLMKMGRISNVLYEFLRVRNPEIVLSFQFYSNGVLCDSIEIFAELSEVDQTYLAIIENRYTPMMETV